MKKLHLFLIIALVVVMASLAACGGQTAAPAAEAPAAGEAATEAPLDLGPTVDVQTVAEVKDRDDVFVIDVREQWEYDEGHIPGVTLIPMNDVPNRLNEIPKDKEVILTCRSGNRSSQVTQFLRDQGFTNIHNMDGGILAWEAAGLDVEK